ncbi:hypothetical protein GQ602_003585 [Ophiocordyceps camponoti-floridani]|uniref:Uncharacterized protein n=1 Tax=Ophiocordyceps camponoti-floridani TaxID=2030778 RepID=A0A8H4VEK1_9HYPO|nr:hypothetical protein GQ602_003585 [Ophiocordyceps camponoti-floridani]
MSNTAQVQGWATQVIVQGWVTQNKAIQNKAIQNKATHQGDTGYLNRGRGVLKGPVGRGGWWAKVPTAEGRLHSRSGRSISTAGRESYSPGSIDRWKSFGRSGWMNSLGPVTQDGWWAKVSSAGCEISNKLQSTHGLTAGERVKVRSDTGWTVGKHEDETGLEDKVSDTHGVCQERPAWKTRFPGSRGVGKITGPRGVDKIRDIPDKITGPRGVDKIRSATRPWREITGPRGVDKIRSGHEALKTDDTLDKVRLGHWAGRKTMLYTRSDEHGHGAVDKDETPETRSDEHGHGAVDKDETPETRSNYVRAPGPGEIQTDERWADIPAGGRWQGRAVGEDLGQDKSLERGFMERPMMSLTRGKQHADDETCTDSTASFGASFLLPPSHREASSRNKLNHLILPKLPSLEVFLALTSGSDPTMKLVLSWSFRWTQDGLDGSGYFPNSRLQLRSMPRSNIAFNLPPSLGDWRTRG